MYIPAKSSPTTKTFKFKVSFPGGWVESNEFTVTWTAAETYTVSFAANGGTGSMADVTGVSGEYTLPANGFTAPAGKQVSCLLRR